MVTLPVTLGSSNLQTTQFYILRRLLYFRSVWTQRLQNWCAGSS